MDSQYSKNKGYLQIYSLTTGTRTALYFVLGSSRIPRRESLSGQSGCMRESFVNLFPVFLHDGSDGLIRVLVVGIDSLEVRIDEGSEFASFSTTIDSLT